MKTFFLPSLWVLCLCGCAAADLKPLERVDASAQATVTVIRGGGMNAGAVNAVVGAGGADWAELETNSVVELRLKPGRYEFFVRAKLKKEPSVLARNIEPSEKLCLQVSPNPANLAAALVPIAGLFTGSTFLLQESPCPDAQALAQLKRVDVSYAEK